MDDIDWLLEKISYADMDQIEWFCERVSIRVIDGGVDLDAAREQSLKEMFE